MKNSVLQPQTKNRKENAPEQLPTLLDNFYHWEKTKPDAPFLHQPFGKQWKIYSWKEVGLQARRMAQAIRDWQLPPQSSIGLVSKNCSHWIIADLAIMMSGHISVPLFPTLSSEQLRQILVHSECQALIVGKLDTWKYMKAGIPSNVKVISLPHLKGNDKIEGKGFLKWDEIQKRYSPYLENYKPPIDNLLTICYTSGTTGRPKGVMTSYYAFAKVAQTIETLSAFEAGNNRFFSYLPLNHIAERVVVEAAALQCGGEIFFAESLDTFIENLREARPTHFLAVPRIWHKFQQGILEKLPQKKLDQLLKLPIIAGMVKKKIKKGLGLDKARFIMTGAAPIPMSLLQWYEKIGLNIREGYGMSENTASCTITPANRKKIGTVGTAQHGAEIKIDQETGEILMRAAWIMNGYFKEPELTSKAIDQDGWLHTGDKGVIDEDGYLTITGRIKEIFKTSKGEYVSPFIIESYFAQNPLIEQICVMGAAMPQPIALIVLSEKGQDMPKVVIEENLFKQLQEVNAKVYSYEYITKVVIVKQTWTVENELLTPTLKMRRGRLEEKYQPYLEDWYKTPGTVIWE